MANRRVFTSRNDYSELEEALESIMIDENDDVESDVFLLPPAPAVVSDEEEGNDDDYCSTIPKDVLGTIEVIPRRPDHDVSDWDDSDDEPLSNRTIPVKRARNQDSAEPVWRKALPIYSTTHDVTDIVQSRVSVVELLKDHSPLMLFEEIFDAEVARLIVENSILYTGQNNRHNFELDNADLRRFLEEYDYRFDTNNEIKIVRWKDNNVVTMGSNFDHIEPLGKVKRWCNTRKTKVDFNIPRLFINYNRGMGGVDQMDQSISLYRVAIKGKKWWWVIFTYLLDMAVSNAWRLHVLLSKNDEDVTYMDQLSFRRMIVRAYL